MILPVNNSIITSPYGWRVLNGQKQFHTGIDFVSGNGDNSVHAILNGRVVYDFDAYEEATRWTDQKMSGGNYVILSHVINDLLYYFRYIHLGENFVAGGQIIQEGEIIGMYKDVGMSFGSHLHCDAYDSQWKPVDISELFKQANLL
jgi:murein DD-endopeptidase MepM/ murein hydrolase activator NlpD